MTELTSNNTHVPQASGIPHKSHPWESNIFKKPFEFEFEFEFIKFANITFTNKYTQINKIKIRKNYIWRGNPKKKPKGL